VKASNFRERLVDSMSVCAGVRIDFSITPQLAIESWVVWNKKQILITNSDGLEKVYPVT
jgi:hypothetical protein